MPFDVACWPEIPEEAKPEISPGMWYVDSEGRRCFVATMKLVLWEFTETPGRIGHLPNPGFGDIARIIPGPSYLPANIADWPPADGSWTPPESTAVEEFRRKQQEELQQLWNHIYIQFSSLANRVKDYGK
jgi:hypothetical protein